MEGDEVTPTGYSDADFGNLMHRLFGLDGTSAYGKNEDGFVQDILALATSPKKDGLLSVALIPDLQAGSEEQDKKDERKEEARHERKVIDGDTDKHLTDQRWETTQMKGHHRESLARHRESKERNSEDRNITPNRTNTECI